MERYEHGGDLYGNPGVSLDFSVNTNPLGMPDEIRRAILAHVDEYTRYPDPQNRALRSALSAHEGLPMEWILCGNGAADLIYRLCYAARPRRALVCAPTFSEYERALESVGCQVLYHALSRENGFRLTTEIAASLVPGVDMLFLCHPNNPTGRLISGDVLAEILNLARRNRTIVVVDECFLNFAEGVSCKKFLEEMPELVVLKAFTKIYAMAGLRLGYLLTANRALREKSDVAAQCWSVSVPAQVAGIAALTCGDWEEKTRRLIGEERRFLCERFAELGIDVFPSDANFLLFQCGRPLREPLLKKGILIRSCENFNGLDRSYNRVSVKTRSENNRLIEAVKEVLNNG